MTSCGGCGRNIVSGTIVTALDASFHSACFVCGLCSKALDGPFYGCGGAPFCENCIDEAERLEAKGQLKKRGAGGGAKDEEEEVPIAARSGGGGGGERSYSPPAPRAASPVHEPPPPVQQSSPAQQSDGDEPTCRKCRRQILSGTIVNALLAAWHESCFRCTTCGSGLDAFYGHDSMPYCENCIDAAEEAPPVISAAPSGPPAIANAFKPAAVPSGNQKPASEPPKTAAASGGGGGNSSYSQLPVPQTHASWEERARVAEEQVRELYQKLSMVKVALAEERRISNEEYSELQGELQRERDRCEQLEKRLVERDRSSGTSNSEMELVNDSLKREQARSRDLERELAQARSTASAERSDDRLSSALLELEASQRQVRDLSSRLRDTENMLENARNAAASSIPASDDSFAAGGAPPPPPPPPGAPPPPPPMVLGGALKITRTGQSAKTADAVEEHNPQADLISELKKGRPQLRRAAAQRPSKRELLTKAANAREAEQERPDPSIVKGADTSNPSARKMASAAEKTAVLAVERDDRVKTGQLKMKVHRNKFLDQFLDSEFK